MMPVSVEDSVLSDEAVAAQARRGSHAAFALLVGRYQDRIYRLAFRMSHNASDAEEITQEAFLSAHRGISSFQAQSRFGTWLYRIAVNAALMRRRAARRHPTQSLDALAVDPGCLRRAGGSDVDGDPMAEELLERKRLAQRVRAALDELDEDSRAALVLRDLEGLSAEHAAAILGVSSDAVRQRAHRARLRLRERLGGDDGVPQVLRGAAVLASAPHAERR